jgi:hypothetical protein
VKFIKDYLCILKVTLSACNVSTLKYKHCSFISVFLFALALRLLNLVSSDISISAVLVEDAAIYWGYANLSQDFFNTVANILFGQSDQVPGYMLFLAAIVSLFGEDSLPPLVTQTIVDSFTCVLIMLIGKRIFPKNYWIFGFLAAISPNLIIHSGMILTETLFTFFFTAFLLAFVRLLERETIVNVLVVGILLGLTTMIRPVTQFAILLIPIFLPLILISIKTKPKKAITIGCITCLASMAILAPILVKNLHKYGSFALTSQNGVHLQYWVAAELVMLRDGVSRAEAIAKMKIKTDRKINDLPEYNRINPFVISSLQSQIAKNEILASTLPVILQSWAQGVLVNLASPAILIDRRVRNLPHSSFAESTSGDLLTRIQQFIDGSSMIYVTILIVSVVGGAVISIIQFLGFFIHFRITPLLATLGLLTLAYFVLVNGPVASPKYRMPIEPVLIIWLGCGLEAVFMVVKKLYSRLAIV